MPELPEVETIRLGLQNKIAGLKIDDMEVRVTKIFQGEKKDVVGTKIKDLRRRAKILIFDLDNGKSLIVHLKLTGQLVFHKNGDLATFGHPIPFAGATLPASTTHVIFTFNNGSKLFYNDVRKFGYIKVVQTNEVEKLKVMAEFGPEPFTKEFTLEKFKSILLKKKKPVKLVLMDQSQIAGVGNIYANEALFLSRIHPQKLANQLNEDQIKKLYESLLLVLKEGIKYGGSSENAYVNALGGKGTMQEHFRVYAQTGKVCFNRCGGVVKRISLGGRGTFFCPKCQR
ncbi:bifunctional DNA-formamidopyrimidine glycosylase/DNA-(apurinic or apyrimidinic site) lyase [Candidatus Microgenomates bacterium]|nr:bifunctional DNA-formamidopyrimidine glycosylase/DNA-(apurinic or apyrimidinic site) lyase [Candidatus Microgenomates bacterium]